MRVTVNTIDTAVNELLELVAHAPSERAVVVGLVGDLGAGKTTFVQALARALHVTLPVTSPTYVIQTSYPLSHPRFDTLVHIDAYRLTEQEVHTIDFARTLALPRTLVVVEWPQKLGAHMPQSITLTFETVSETERDITFHNV